MTEKVSITKLKANGANDRSLMFLTGLAGSGKYTGINLAWTFCFEFGQYTSLMFDDESFYFTAITGSAASLFQGITLASVAHLQK